MKDSRKISKTSLKSLGSNSSKVSASTRIKKQLWMTHKDNLVRDLYKKLGPRWSEIGRAVGNRRGKQVRDRYMNYLRPDISYDEFTPEEDRSILELNQAI